MNLELVGVPWDPDVFHCFVILAEQLSLRASLIDSDSDSDSDVYFATT